MQKPKVGPLPHTYTKIHSKWIKYINVRVEIVKLLEESIGVHLYYLGLSNSFLDMTLKA